MPLKLSTGTPTIPFLNGQQLPRRPDGVWQFDDESRRLPVWTAQNLSHNRTSNELAIRYRGADRSRVTMMTMDSTDLKPANLSLPAPNKYELAVNLKPPRRMASLCRSHCSAAPTG
jgi:hypothetical protein